MIPNTPGFSLQAFRHIIVNRKLEKDQRVAELASQIKAVAFDWDGVFTTNQFVQGLSLTIPGSDPVPLFPRVRSFYDGQGVSNLRAIGIHVGIFTNEKGESARAVEDFVNKMNNLSSATKPVADGGWHPVHLSTGTGKKGKDVVVEEWLERLKVSWTECAGMGDDLVDIPFLKRVLLKVAPSTAELLIKDMAHITSRRPGGNGAVRDFTNFVLAVRGIDPTTLSPG